MYELLYFNFIPYLFSPIKLTQRESNRNMKAKRVLDYLVTFLAFCFLESESPVQGRLLSLSKPQPDDAATFARCTISSDLGGAPFGNVVSFSDGLPDKGRGVPYFYLTTLDPTARNGLKDQRSSFTISEYPVGTCGKADPENPTCAKITLTGKLKVVDGNTGEAEFARTALFTKHPEMEGWPKGHNFQFFKLEIENIFMINWFGGAKPLTVEQYLNAKMNKLSFNAWMPS